ncbi:hypothetical protein ACWGIU_11410 [Streptomyces sp. NPDC054840]
MTANTVFLIPEALLAPAITAPASANIGSAAPGSTTTVQLGQVKVTSSGTLRWAATVSATNFTTGGGSPGQTIAPGNLSYWSGPVVSKTGPGTFSPGQPTAANQVTLNVARTAFTYSTALTTSSSVIWQPTLIMSVPANAVSGSYTGTVTHSVA